MDHLLKKKERIQKFKETGDKKYIYKNELDKACFQHDIACGGFKDLAKITASNKVWRDKKLNIAKNPKYGGYLACMVDRFFDTRTAFRIKSMQNQQFANGLHKPIIRKF